jgi:dTDP-glucose 4,6-dehydratase
MMSRKILVTGGSGFIGLNFIKLVLNNTSDIIINMDLLTYASNLDIDKFKNYNNYEFVRGDISNPKHIESLLDKYNNFDVIVHFAAESHVDRSIENASPFLSTNIIGTFHLLEIVRKGKANRMIHISTDEVYGSLSKAERPFTETSPIKPNNPYSASKASSDLLALSYFHTHNTPVIITRCTNNFGPHQHKEKFIPTIITNTLHKQKIPLYGDGLNVRDWIFVEDHCRAIQLVMNNGVEGEIYNIGTNNEKTNKEVITHILSLLGEENILIQYIEDRKGHDRRYAIDSSKIKTELGWKPKITFEEGIKKTINWYVSQHQRGGN